MNGNIKSFNGKEKVLKKELTKNGYHRITLFREKKRKRYLVHRLIAEIFIPNPENKPEVNHINGIKTDNRAENLEWVTASENQLHSSKVLNKQFYTRKIVCIETGTEYESLADVTRKTGISYKHLPGCCRGKRKTVGGYHWKYKD